MKQRFIHILMFFTLVAFAVSVKAQTEYKPLKIKNKITSNNETRYKPITIKKDTLGSFSSRVSVSTNFIDWMLFTPNIGFDFDIGDNNMIGAQSIYFNFKYKPDFQFKNNLTKENLVTVDESVLGTLNPFTYWSGRIEYRWHFRWNEHPGQRRGMLRPTLGLYNALTKLDYKSEAMSRVMESSQLKRPQMIRGRHYVGFFGEYMNYMMNSKLDIIGRKNIKNGYALMGGLTLGYEFPAFFNKNHYWQFHVGANVGVIYSPYDKYSVDKTLKTATFSGAEKKILPMVTELKFGMTFRKNSISEKYWKPSNKAQVLNIAENREMQALIDSITENYSTQTKIFITVPKAGNEMAIKTPIEKKDVIKAIRQQTKMPLAAANFVNDTIFPIKRLDDYTITYRFKKAINKYSDELEEYTDVVFRFRVELEGRNEAEKLKQNFINAIQKYRNERGIPVLYANAKPKSGDRNEIDGYIPWNEVMTLFSRIWGKTISLQQFKGVSLRVGNGIVRPVDEKGINRRSRYTISMQFHPQVEFNYETDPTLSQFEVQFRGEASGLSNYNKINGHRLTFERAYKGSDEFSPEITAKEIADALKKDGIETSEDNIEVSSGLNKFGQRYSAAVYLQAGYVANISFVVNDKGGLEKAKADFNSKINPWVQSRKWPEVVVQSAPTNPKELNISESDIVKAFSKASGYQFKDYQFIDFCVDGAYTLMQDGRYRAYARVQLHRELGTVPKIPYYIRFDNSAAERLAKQKAEQERITREKAEAERLAAEKAEAERLAKEKAESERLAAEKKRQEEERIAREKAEAERLAREKFVADSIAEVKAELDRLAKLAREKAVADSIEAAKLEAERLACEKFVADSIANAKKELDRLAKEARDKAVADSIAAAKAELDRLAKLAREKAVADSIAEENARKARIEREKFVADSINNAKLEADRLAAERAEAERIERERLETERLAKEKAEAERLAAEKKRQEEEKAKARAEEEAKAKVEAERMQKEMFEDFQIENIDNKVENIEERFENKKEEAVQQTKPVETKKPEEKKQKVGIIVQRSEQPVKQQPKPSVNNMTYDQAKADYDTKVAPWLNNPKHKQPEIIFRGEQRDPKELNITLNQIVTAFRKASDYIFKDFQFIVYCVDNNYEISSDGRYKAKARLQMHADMEPFEVEYFIRFAH